MTKTSTELPVAAVVVVKNIEDLNRFGSKKILEQTNVVQTNKG